MPTNLIVSTTDKLAEDLTLAASLKAQISALETDLKQVAQRIIKASKVHDQYQVANGKLTVSARVTRSTDVDVLRQVDPVLADIVVEPKVSWTKWDAAAKLGIVSDEAAALVVETEGEPHLVFSLSKVK